MTDGILRSFSRQSFTTQAPYPMPPPGPKLLDTYPTNVVAAYSFRQLSNAYSGSAVRIRRSSDNAELDIGFDGSGNFDTAAAAAHIGGGTGFIVTWYDQAENDMDATNSTAGTQPDYVESAISSLPGAGFDGVDETLKKLAVDLTAKGISTQGTILTVLLQLGSDAQNTSFGWHGSASNRIICHPSFDDVIYFDFGSTVAGRVSAAQPSGWDDTAHIVELYRDSSDNQAIVVDSVSLVSATKTVDITTTAVPAFEIGSVTGIHFGGYISELVVWGTDLGSTDRTGARNDVNAYWSVF